MSIDMDELLQNQNNILSKLQRPSQRQLRRRGGLAMTLQPLSSSGVNIGDVSQYCRILFGDGQSSFPATAFELPSSAAAEASSTATNPSSSGGRSDFNSSTQAQWRRSRMVTDRRCNTEALGSHSTLRAPQSSDEGDGGGARIAATRGSTAAAKSMAVPHPPLCIGVDGVFPDGGSDGGQSPTPPFSSPFPYSPSLISRF
ncbi:uncharacterized protein LOC107611183 [Arachis ipaensis]|uniref:uncharacterized protein LOC107611183 n=1 Tax=Arachis ipaensis TaxID=130454 RepID=UPI0007AFCB52|nr:uncharacterized protein LOC107611183 [Arachis ipaensis]